MNGLQTKERVQVPRTEDNSQDSLRRGLGNRHLQMISLGGTIGVGLFLGSGGSIHRAGPGLLFTYILAGAVVFLIIRALGELTLYRPVSGSFAAYASEFLGPLSGFITGWTYWFAWIATVTAEITAMGIYVTYWFPSVPPWITALVVVVVLFLLNLLSVRIFGELEYWFATIKIATILGLIFIGVGVLMFGFSSLGEQASVSNLWAHDGLFPRGAWQSLLAVQMVIFAFFGLEMIGITAGEAENPQKSLPKAINRIGLRIGLFYIGSLVVIMLLIPWHKLDPTGSPFVLVFERIGIPAAATVMNFVVLTAAFSSSNSAVFGTGRMLYSLAHTEQAPKMLKRVNRHRVPSLAIRVSTIALTIAVVVNYLVPDRAFFYVTSVGTLGAILVWGIILIAHLRYRAAVKAGKLEEGGFKMPGTPWTNWIALAFLGFVTVLLGFHPDTRVALYVAPFWIALVVGSYLLMQWRRKRVRLLASKEFDYSGGVGVSYGESGAAASIGYSSSATVAVSQADTD